MKERNIVLLILMLFTTLTYSSEKEMNRMIDKLIKDTMSKNDEMSQKAYYELVRIGPSCIPKFLEILKDPQKKKYHDKIEDILFRRIFRNIRMIDENYYAISISSHIYEELYKMYSDIPIYLGYLGYREAVPLLAQYLLKGKGHAVEVIEALAMIGDSRAIEPLRKVRKKELQEQDTPSPWILQSSERAIKLIEIKNELRNFDDRKEKVKLLINLLKQERDLELKSYLLSELVKTKERGLLTVLVDTKCQLDGSPAEFASEVIEYYLISMPVQEAIKEIQEQNTSLRERIIYTLGYGKYTESIELMKTIEKIDPDSGIRQCIRKVLKDVESQPNYLLRLPEKVPN